MHIIECHFEFSGFDDHLVKAGTSVYLWNLSQQFRERGHRVTALTAAHGLLPSLRSGYDVEELDWAYTGEIPVPLDPAVWPGFPAVASVPVDARAYRMVVDGVEIVLLGGGVLDAYPDSFYPPPDLDGRDLAFLKPLVFQVAAARFLADRGAPGAVVHMHEPIYHFLLPAVLSVRGFTAVSTVQTNLPVNTKVYAPQARALLRFLGAPESAVDGLDDPPLDSDLHRAMRGYLPRTLLYRDRPGDYVSVVALVARTAAAVDFLSEGQLAHAATQAATPFEQLFTRLAVHRELTAHAGRLVVGGCAIGEPWHTVTRSPERRSRVLGGLGLDPALPTIYHNGRYQIEHKGVRELLRALRRLLDGGVRANVLLHLLQSRPAADADLEALVRDHPDLVRARTDQMVPAVLMDWASSSDIGVFPAKFEMDTFLIAMGEAMAAGAVPLATAQRGTEHFGCAFDLTDPSATGLAVPRSFRSDDPLLTDAVTAGLRRLVGMVAAGDPLIGVLRDRAVARARQFTWGNVAERFLAVFEACVAGTRPADAVPRSRPLAVGLPVAAGHGSASPAGDTVRVVWAGPGVARVEAVRPVANRVPGTAASGMELGGETVDGGRLGMRMDVLGPDHRADVVGRGERSGAREPVRANDTSRTGEQPVHIVVLDRQPDGTFAGRVPTAKSVTLLVTDLDGGSVWIEVGVEQTPAG